MFFKDFLQSFASFLSLKMFPGFWMGFLLHRYPLFCLSFPFISLFYLLNSLLLLLPWMTYFADVHYGNKILKIPLDYFLTCFPYAFLSLLFSCFIPHVYFFLPLPSII